MRAGAGMAEKDADPVGRLRREDVLEFASLVCNFCLILDSQAFRK